MKNPDKKILIVACFIAALTIGLGAFGAHGLKQFISGDSLLTFETGVRYQMYHVLALIGLAVSTGISGEAKIWVFRFFIFGILLFSGSIYVLSMSEILAINTKFLGPITPIGGFMFILGWLRWGYALLKSK